MAVSGCVLAGRGAGRRHRAAARKEGLNDKCGPQSPPPLGPGAVEWGEVPPPRRSSSGSGHDMHSDHTYEGIREGAGARQVSTCHSLLVTKYLDLSMGSSVYIIPPAPPPPSSAVHTHTHSPQSLAKALATREAVERGSAGLRLREGEIEPAAGCCVMAGR